MLHELFDDIERRYIAERTYATNRMTVDLEATGRRDGISYMAFARVENGT